MPGGQCTGTAAGLTAGETYQFRVKAVNKAGPGQPSEETGPIVAKPRRRIALFVFLLCKCLNYFYIFSGSKTEFEWLN